MVIFAEETLYCMTCSLCTRKRRRVWLFPVININDIPIVIIIQRNCTHLHKCQNPLPSGLSLDNPCMYNCSVENHPMIEHVPLLVEQARLQISHALQTLDGIQPIQ